MLWQDADVASVSKVAVEWTEHRAALATHAEVLREQRAALAADWHGAAADEATARLGALADRIEKIGELAQAGQRAAQDAADALASARAEMPPPPAGPPMGLTVPAGAVAPALGAPQAAGLNPQSAFGAPPGTAALNLPSAPAAFGPGAGGLSLPSAPAALTLPSAPAFNPAAGGTGFSFYFGVASADQQKAQAVRAMQTYESSLNGSSRLIDDARGAVPQATGPATPGSGVQRAAPTAQRASQSAGVPWQRLAGGGGASRGMGAVAAVPSGSAQLSPGMRAGVVLGMTGGPTGFAAPAPDTGARGTAQSGGMAPPAGGARGGDDDQPHENQMPTLDHGLFELDERACPPVIGVES